MKSKVLIVWLVLVIGLNLYAQDDFKVEVAKKKTYFPVGLFNQKNSNIYGVSLGFGSDLDFGTNENLVRSNGVRLEPISDALLIFTLFFGPNEVHYPDNVVEFNSFNLRCPNEIVNGINLSAGTNSFININGITLSGISQSLKKSNGISIAGLASGSFRNNGIQIAGGGTSSVFSNGIIASYISSSVHKGNGIQISSFNEYVNFRGLQVGIVNDIYGISERFSGLQIGLYNCTKKLKGVQLGLINKNEKRTLPLINWQFKA